MLTGEHSQLSFVEVPYRWLSRVGCYLAPCSLHSALLTAGRHERAVSTLRAKASAVWPVC